MSPFLVSETRIECVIFETCVCVKYEIYKLSLFETFEISVPLTAQICKKNLHADFHEKVFQTFHCRLYSCNCVSNSSPGPYKRTFWVLDKNYFLFNNFFEKIPKKNIRACTFIRERRVNDHC